MGGDFFRTAPGRYLGYAHTVGSSIPGDILSPVTRIWMTRATLGYMVFDVIHKASDNRSPNLVAKGVDAALWQGLASVVVPSLLLRGTNHVSSLLVNGLKVQSPANRYVSLGLALLALPIFGPQIDKAVHKVLDNTTRPIIF